MWSQLKYDGSQGSQCMFIVAYACIINSGVQVQVLLFGDCAFLWHRLCGVLIIMGYFSMRLNVWYYNSMHIKLVVLVLTVTFVFSRLHCTL